MKQKESHPVEKLIDILMDSDYRASHQASCDLISMGNRAIASLERALQQVPVQSQKASIYTTLKDIRSAEAAAVLLSQFSKESNDYFRTIIAEGLGLARCREAGPILEQALNTAHDEGLSWAIRIALAHVGEVEDRYRAHLAWLLERADDLDELNRAKAIQALGTFNLPATREKLLQRLQNDENSAIKALAASSLAKYAVKDIQRPLRSIAEAGDTEAGLFASLLLSYLQQEPLPIPVEELADKIRGRHPQGQIAAIRVLSWFYPDHILTLLVDFLIGDSILSVKREVVGVIGWLKDTNASANAAGAIATLQGAANGKTQDEVELLAATALVKLGWRDYLNVVRERFLDAKDYAEGLSMFVLIELDAQLQNDFIPFLLDLANSSPRPKVQASIEFLLHGKYWRDPRLLPYFRACLAGTLETNRLSLAHSLLRMSEEGYKPAYHLLKDFLGEEPSQEAIRRYFFWLFPNDGVIGCAL